MTPKKTIKVRDLKPIKDAKGGGGHSINTTKPQGTGVNTTKPQGHGHSHN